MSLYRITSEKLEPVLRTSFATEKLLERKDIQRLLRGDISVVGEDLMVIAEEFGEWEDCSRRIDLLCLSKDGGLVVVEIKRTDTGGHMELQAIRYAAMVSSMTLEQLVEVFAKTNGKDSDDARDEVLAFLQADSEEEAELTGDVRIILVSADFSTELTTSVLWLNQRDLDITCIRLRPYRIGDEVLIDATQIIPLPESADYEVKLRKQEKEKRKVLSARHEILRRFWVQLFDRSRETTPLLANRTPGNDTWITSGIGRSGFQLNTVLNQHRSVVECYIRLPAGEEASKAAFHSLQRRKREIESRFGDELKWEELPGRQGSRISKELAGGWKSPESDWPELHDRLIDALVRMEGALKQVVQEV